VYLREMNFAAGGVGCAAWDGAIILARFLRRIRNTLAGRRVHEVGAGVGLPGIVAARYAASCVLSDYIPSLVENLDYNIALNGARRRVDEAPAAPDTPNAAALHGDAAEDVIEEYRGALRQRVSHAATTAVLDWEEVRHSQTSTTPLRYPSVTHECLLTFSLFFSSLFSLLLLLC
jgi:predicted nicotinamide N-methyase